MKLVEQLGSGVPRILQSYGSESCCFSENFTRMSFPLDEVIQQDVEVLNEGLNEGLNVGVKKLFVFIENNPGTNVLTMAKQFKVTQRTIERWVKIVREENKIEFKGVPKTGGYWASATTN